MKKIERTALLAIDCYNYGSAVSAIQKSMAQNEFDQVLFFTDIKIELDGIRVVQIPPIRSKHDYSHFVIKELWKYITTDFVLMVQHDGYTLNGDLFDERLYDYDYCGALWHNEVDGYANGNGGYSWRSRRLLEAIGNDEHVKATIPEDAQICRTYRDHLEKTYGLKWAPDDICEGFSFEVAQPAKLTMGFHGKFHAPYRPTIILKRSGAMGDIIMMEPVMRYYILKGWNVVLDIPIIFWPLFSEHYFPVKHISHFDRSRITPEKEVNLDMSYEIKPRQLYLKTYFEMCGVTDYILTRPNLYPLVDDKSKMFKQYALIHIDKRETQERNTQGVNWRRVTRHLEALGYTVLQLGLNDHDVVATELNTQNVGFLKYVIAGCDIFIGVDSGLAAIAAAYFKKSILLFGSVNPEFIHANFADMKIIQGNCDKAHCWHQPGSTTGKECFYKGTDEYLQCCKHDAEDIVDAINELHNKKDG